MVSVKSNVACNASSTIPFGKPQFGAAESRAHGVDDHGRDAGFGGDARGYLADEE